MYGRLKQGVLPYGAPPGYKNNGEGGQQKTIDPVQGPLVRETFERYATGNYSYETLIELMTMRGLRNTAGKPFRISGICNLLRNSYYYGIIVTKGQTFSGTHEPLITKITFDACKAQREGRVAPRPEPTGLKEYAFRRLILCQTCSRSLIAEKQKGHIYYRCHTRSCPTTCVRESSVFLQVRANVTGLPNFDQFEAVLRRLFAVYMSDLEKRAEAGQTSLALRQGQIKIRQNRLTELLIEDTIDQQTYDTKKLEIQNQLIEIQEERARIQGKDTINSARLEKMLELAKRLILLPETENPRQLREMIKTATSNLSAYEKTIDIQWSNTFKVLFSLGGIPVCGHEHNESRKVQLVTKPEHRHITRTGVNVSQGGHGHNESRKVQLVTDGDKPAQSELVSKTNELFLALQYETKLDNWTPHWKVEEQKSAS
jgi:site-specific DNA recombinase